MTLLERSRIALRYTFALGQGHLSAFLSLLSMLGLVLAISLLIIVLSVMNGFDKEMRERILSLVPHVTLYPSAPLRNWHGLIADIKANPEVIDVAAFVQFDALLMRGAEIETVRGIGLDGNAKAAVGPLSDYLAAGDTSRFRKLPDGLILGVDVARRLRVSVGERITLIVPSAARGGQKGRARHKIAQVAAILNTGTELDQNIALVHLSMASELAGMDGRVSGFRLTTRDLFAAQQVSWQLLDALPPGYYSTNWMMTHGNLYAAIQLSRDLISILLFSIIAVAAFNVVSSLVLVVLDKQGNIAILRTLGATSSDIAWIFVLQGALIGVVGVTLGSVAGALGSLAVPGAVSYLEQLLEISFLNTDVYPVAFLPVDVLAKDIFTVGAVAWAMCVLAAIYPARRASQLAPAVVLSQDH